MQGMKTMRMLIAAVVACVMLGAAAPAQAQDLDAALKPIATYKFGDSREALSVANDLLRKADNAGGEEQKAAEAKLLALLSSNPTPDCVDFICRQLAMIGSEASVPVLAPMLVKDEQSADWARYALEGISGEAVDEALLNALTSVSGRARVGIINSLGIRKTESAVKPLAAIAADKQDAAVASAALASLGLIGGDDAADALEDERGNVAGELKPVADDAYIACANAYLADGKKDKAVKMYNKLNNASEPVRVQAAAIVALAKAEPAKTQSTLLTLLKGDDEYLQAVAVGQLRNDATAVGPVAQELANLKPDAQVLAIGVLQQHADKAALSAVAEAAKSADATVQVAAIRALGVLGDAATVPTLLTAATSGTPEARRAASESLDSLRGADVDPMMLGAMAGADTDTRIELIRSLAARNAKSALPALMAAANDPDDTIRAKSFDALGVLAGPSELSAIIDLLIKMNGNSAQPQAESAVVAVSQKVPQADARAQAALGALDASKDEKVRASLTNVAGRIGDSTALPKIRELAAQTGEATVQDTAVRALADWSTTETLDDLRKIAADSKNDAHRAQAFNGMIRVARMDNGPDVDTKLKVYEEAIALAKSPDDKRLVLAGLGQVADARALALVDKLANDEAVKDEAKQAKEQITKATTK